METSAPHPGGGPPDLITAVIHLNAGKYFQIAAVIVLIYDHMLTFSEEVCCGMFWEVVAGLMLDERYGNLLSFIVIIDAFNDPSWSKEVCDRFAIFEGAQSLTFIAMVMILRIYALYGRSTPVLVLLMTLWCVQVAMSGVGISTGNAVDLPPGLIGCILVGTNPLFPALWVSPLITDTCIFILTIYRIRPFTRRRAGKTPMIQIFIRDGVMYFFAIFTANLINCLIYFLAPEDLRALGASFSQVLTSVMISRLVLNLRSLRDKDRPDTRQITHSLDFVAAPRTNHASSVQFQQGHGDTLTYGHGQTSGWVDDPDYGVQSARSGWRGSRGFWGGFGDSGNNAAMGTGTVATFMTHAIGNLGEEFEHDESSAGTVLSDRHWKRRDGRLEERRDDVYETELKVMDSEGSGPRAV
ncbi:hypothetical protein CVT24_002996 [Panaeolus cyanescens]|uniref:DUF6533 domain-containing protein n=1 Tax=Panaeolus cyanescens TaxID=181874 RepID=A0A409YXY6_9AGAR|nr:hypothetical protein CVT24_002996 [Panaeolus cyanescens]